MKKARLRRNRMIQLLVIRDKIKGVFSRYYTVILPVLKFLAAFLSYLIINMQIGYNDKLVGIATVIALSVLSAFLPLSVTVFFAAALTLGHIYAASMFLSVIFLLIIAVLYFMFVRFAPGYGIVVLTLPVLAYFKLEILVPLVLGLTGSPIAIFALIPAVITSSLFNTIKEAVKLSSGVTQLEDNLQNYIFVIKSLTTDRAMILMMIACISVLIATYTCRKLVLSHANELGIIAGIVVNFVVTLVGGAVVGVDGNILWLFLGSLAAGFLAYIFQFFRYILDFTAVEHLQFDDDDYYYYVTAVPKLSVTSPNLNIIKVNAPKNKKER